jgi:ribosomal protein S27E
MKISDVTCPHCGALYLLAESVSVDGSPGNEACKICGKTLASSNDGKLRAFRLMMSPVPRPISAPLSPTISP